MKKTRSISIVILAALISSCGIITILPSSQWEKVNDFKVSLEAKPSELIKNFLGDIYENKKNNYCLTFFDIYCAHSYTQVNYINKLYNETKESCNWNAVTIYDSIAETKFRKKLGYTNNYLQYLFPVFYEINGLKSSLRNLYYKNNITTKDFVPMTFVIVNDSIKFISDGAINSEEKYFEVRHLLDSLLRN